MKQVVASAPGKLVICGEYAVLDGAPGISAALDRRAAVSMAAADSWSVVCPGFMQDEREFSVASDAGRVRLRWPGGASPVPLLDAAFEEAGGFDRFAEAGIGPYSMRLDTTDFHVGGDKLGLGSSAALIVALVAALVAALSAAAGSPEEGTGRSVRSLALSAHRRLQRGRGSGIDVATSIAGGLIRYTADDAVAGPLDWPEGLHAAVLWSGVEARTTKKLAHLAAASPHSSRPALKEAAVRVAAAWQTGDAGAVLAALPAWSTALAAFSDAYGLDVFAAGHAELIALARQQGLVYKPCGAGGGDVGVALGTEAAAVDEFAHSAVLRGFERLPSKLGKARIEGLEVEWTQD